MSRRARLSRPARTDLVEIWVYVAENDPKAADRLIEALHSRCNLLARLPRLGRLPPDVAPGIRSFPFGRYLILYRERKGGIEVVRVCSGRRDLKRLFE